MLTNDLKEMQVARGLVANNTLLFAIRKKYIQYKRKSRILTYQKRFKKNEVLLPCHYVFFNKKLLCHMSCHIS